MEKCFCGNDLTPAGIMISHVHNKGEWMSAYYNMQMDMSGNLLGKQNISSQDILKRYVAAPEKMKMNMQMLMLMVGLTDNLSLMGMLNYNSKYMEMSMKMGDVIHQHAMAARGLGDTKITALYAIIKREHLQIIANLGLSCPTGNFILKGSPVDMMFPNSRLPYNMQLGSGTCDLMPGLTYTLKKEKLSFSSQINLKFSFWNNILGYRYGNEYQFNAWYAYAWLPFISSSLRIQTSYIENLKGKDTSLLLNNEPGANYLNSGGQSIFTYVGTVMQFKKGVLNRFRIGLEYGFPLLQKLNGIQMALKQNININASIKF